MPTFEEVNKLLSQKGPSAAPTPSGMPAPAQPQAKQPAAKPAVKSFADVQSFFGSLKEPGQPQQQQKQMQPPPPTQGPKPLSLKDKVLGLHSETAKTDHAVTADDTGVFGRVMQTLKETHPVPGVNRNLGELLERYQNPLGETDVAVARRKELEAEQYKKMTEGRSWAVKAGATIMNAAGDFMVDQLSPMNMSLLLGGPIAGMVKEAVTVPGQTMKVAKTLNKLMSFYFATQMANGAIDSAEGSVDAFKRGDWETGLNMAIGGLINGVFAHGMIDEGMAERKVKLDLNEAAQKAHGKDFKEITPQQQAGVIHTIANEHPFTKRLINDEEPTTKKEAKNYNKARDQFTQQQQMMREHMKPGGEEALESGPGVHVPVVSGEARQEDVESNAADQRAKAVEDLQKELKARRARRAEEKLKQDEKSARDHETLELLARKATEEFESRRAQALEAMPTPEKRPSEEPPVILEGQAPQTPAAREEEAYRTRVEDARRLSEAEGAIRAYQEEERKKREADGVNAPPFTIVDRRSHPDLPSRLHEEDYTSLPPEKLTDEQRLHESLGKQLRSQAEAMFPESKAGPGVIYERLKAKNRERTFPLEPEERRFMSLYARRQALEKTMRDPKAMRDSYRLGEQVKRETVARIIEKARREHNLYRAAEDLRAAGNNAGSPEEADQMARQANEAEELARKLAKEREEDQTTANEPEEESPHTPEGPQIPNVPGRATNVMMTDDTQLPARYAAVRLSSLVVSHDHNSFQWNPRYEPRRMQPRDLESNKEAQAKAIDQSLPGKYRLDALTSDDPSAINGPAIILPDGRIAGGNSRTVRLKRVLETDRRREIIEGLHRSLDKFGVTGEHAIDYDDPWVPVRILESQSEATEELIRLGEELNRDPIMGFTPAESAVKAGQRITHDDLELFSNWMEQLATPSLRTLMNNRGLQIFDILVERGIIPENKRAAYIVNTALEHETPKWELAESAKDEFEQMILGRVIDDVNIIKSTPKETMAKIERALPALVKIRSSSPEWNILEHMKQALREWRQIASIREELKQIGNNTTDSIVDRYYHPENYKLGTGMMNFGDGPSMRQEPHPVTYGLVRMLEGNQLDVKKALTLYGDEAEGRQASLMATMTPVEAFNRYIVEPFVPEHLKKAEKEAWLKKHEVSNIEWLSEKPATVEEKEKFEKETENPPKPTKEQKAEQIEPTIDPLPGMKEAEQKIVNEVKAGEPTPEGLRAYFESDPRFKPYADMFMKIFGKIIPNATGESLGDFLKNHLIGIGNHPDEEGYRKWFDQNQAKLPPNSIIKGAAMKQNGKHLIHLFEHGDVATVLHEFLHVMRPYLTPSSMRVMEDYAHETLAKAARGKSLSRTIVYKPNRRFVPTPGVWTREKEEVVARAFERYMSKGEAPTLEMRDVFSRLRDIFRRIYMTVTGVVPDGSPIKITVTPELRELFDQWFGKEPGAKRPPALKEMAKPPAAEGEEVKPRLRVVEVSKNVFHVVDEKGKTKQIVKTREAAQKIVDVAHKYHSEWLKKQYGGERKEDMAPSPPPESEGYKATPITYVRDKKGDIDYGATLAALPKIKKGFVRLFRSESPSVKFKDVFKADDINRATGMAENRPAGSSYTPDLKYAEYYRATYGKDASTHYVDVPEAEAKASEFAFGEHILKGRPEMAPPPPPEEAAPPESSIETEITPEEREQLMPGFHAPVHYNEVDGVPRVKRFENLVDARAWALSNRGRYKGMTTWVTPDSKAVMMFVPNDGETLFQMGPPPGGFTLEQKLRRIEELKRERDRPGADRIELTAKIQRLEASTGGLGGQSGLILGGGTQPPASGIIGLSRPPEFRDPVAPEKSVPLFPSEEMKEPPREQKPEAERGPSQRPGEVPDGRPRIPEAGRNERVDESTAGPLSGEKTGPGRDSGRERPGRKPVPGDPGYDGKLNRNPFTGKPNTNKRKPDFIEVKPVELEAPEKMRGKPTVDEKAWEYRLAELRMPVGIPPKTVTIDKDILAVLGKFPGQAEVVEITASALEQYDGAVIATPTGTGKTFTSMAVAKHLERSGAKRGLIVTMNRKIIEQKNGWKDVGKKFFNMEVEDVPQDLRELPEGRYVTTYAQLIKRKENLANFPFDYVIFDESAAARRWYDTETQQGDTVRRLSDAAKKAVYVSATPFHEALEYGYMTKLGMWKKGQFDKWAAQFGARRNKKGNAWQDHGNSPKQLVKLREQLIARGQFVTQERNFEGYTAHFALVPMTEEVRTGLNRGEMAFREAQNYYRLRNKPALAEAAKRVAATWKKAYLERMRLPEAIEIMQQAKKQGWQTVLFSETDKARDEMFDFMEQADIAMNGRLSQLLPPYKAVFESLSEALGADNVSNYSGSHSTKRTGELDDWLAARKDHLFATYSAGGTGVSMHDDSTLGIHPRMAIYLGPSYSGIAFEQAMGRLWRYGTNSDVHSIFMTSDAVPEVRMMATKIAPRLAALRAAVSGIKEDDPMVRRMRNQEDSITEGAGYELGSKIDYSSEDFKPANEEIPIAHWKEVQLRSAERAKGKGMKYPGQKDKPGIIESEQLFQIDGEPILPERFLSPEEAKARLMNEEVMQALADGEEVPVAKAKLKPFGVGARIQLANSVGPVVSNAIETAALSGADPVAEGRKAIRTGMTEIMAAREAGLIGTEDVIKKESDAAWKVTQLPLPEGTPEKTPDPSYMDDKPITADFWLTSGRKTIINVTRQAGVGHIGHQIVRNYREYNARSANYAGDFVLEYISAMQEAGTTGKEAHKQLVLAKQGIIPPVDAKHAAAIQKSTALLNRIRKMAADRGIVVEYFDDDNQRQTKPYEEMFDDPFYYPHIHDLKEKINVTNAETGEKFSFTLQQMLGDRTLSDIQREKIITAMMSETGKSKGQIERWLASRQRRMPLGGNMERARSANLPYYRTDMGGMIVYLEQAARLLARADVFGQDREKLDGLTAQIHNKKARDIVETVNDQLLKPRPWDRETSKWYSRFASAEIISKMVFSPVKVPFHLAHTTVVTEGFGPLLKGMFDTATNWKEAKARATFNGALMEQVKAQMILEQGSELRLANHWLKATLFDKTYQISRIIGNATGEAWMEGALPKLIKKGKNAPGIRAQLKDDLLLSDEAIDKAIQTGQWTRDDMARGAAAFIQKTMFTSDPSELPISWRGRSDNTVSDQVHMAFRMATLLKSFMFKTSALLKEQLIDEAVQYIRSGGKEGTLKAWIPFLIAYPLAGEAMKGLTAGFQTVIGEGISEIFLQKGMDKTPLGDYERKLEDLFNHPTARKMAQRWMDDVGASTALEMFTHLADVVFFPNSNKKIAQFQLRGASEDMLYDVLGPTYSDMWKTGILIKDMLGTNSIEHGEKKWEKEGKLLKKYLRDISPLLRNTLPSNETPTAKFQPPPPAA